MDGIAQEIYTLHGYPPPVHPHSFILIYVLSIDGFLNITAVVIVSKIFPADCYNVNVTRLERELEAHKNRSNCKRNDHKNLTMKT